MNQIIYIFSKLLCVCAIVQVFCACGTDRLDLDGTQSGRYSGNRWDDANLVKVDWTGETTAMSLVGMPRSLSHPKLFSLPLDSSGAGSALVVWGRNEDALTCSGAVLREGLGTWEQIPVKAGLAPNCHQACLSGTRLFYCGDDGCYVIDLASLRPESEANLWKAMNADSVRDKHLLGDSTFAVSCSGGQVTAVGNQSGNATTQNTFLISADSFDGPWVEKPAPVDVNYDSATKIEVFGKDLLWWRSSEGGAFDIHLLQNDNWRTILPPVDMPKEARAFIVPAGEKIIIRFYALKNGDDVKLDKQESIYYGQFRYNFNGGTWRVPSETMPVGPGMTYTMASKRTFYWGGEEIINHGDDLNSPAQLSCAHGGFSLDHDFKNLTKFPDRNVNCRGYPALAIMTTRGGSSNRLAVFGGCAMSNSVCSSWIDSDAFFLDLP